MPSKTRNLVTPGKKKAARRSSSPSASLAIEVESVIASLKRLATKKYRDGMARYAIPTENAFGVPVGKIRDLGKRLKQDGVRQKSDDQVSYDAAAARNHELAAALWQTGWYEARMLCAFLDDPALVTPAQMDRWCRDFDNWAICDTLCFHLFDKTPHAFAKVEKWSNKKGEFVKRAAFALLASVALHDKRPHSPAVNEPFADGLLLIERAASDQRNFVKKGVSWALRAIGGRNLELHIAALWFAERLVASSEPSARWVGKDALRDITRPSVIRKVASKRRDLRR